MSDFNIGKSNISTKNQYTYSTLHANTTANGDGEKFEVGGFKTFTFGIKGSSTARTIEFRGIDANGVDDLIMCVKNKDFSTGTSTTNNNETWQASIEGYEYFYAKVTAVTGGNVVIVGKAVA